MKDALLSFSKNFFKFDAFSYEKDGQTKQFKLWAVCLIFAILFFAVLRFVLPKQFYKLSRLFSGAKKRIRRSRPRMRVVYRNIRSRFRRRR